MQTSQNLPQNSPNSNEWIGTNDSLALAALIEAELSRSGPGRTVIELGDRQPAITPRAALALAARACEHLLTGQPEICTFDTIDLELAIPLLRQMAATIRGVEP